MRINLFGNLQMSFAGRPVTAVNTNRLHSLIAYLILHGDTPQPRERLAFLLWPASSESQARTNLRQLLHHLRRALPAECCLLTADHHTVHWRRDPCCAVDVWEFDGAIERGALEEAAQLCPDDLLRGLYDEWLQPKREQYRQRLADALSRLAAALEERRDFAAAIRYTERLVAD